jgi:hypothetical protein
VRTVCCGQPNEQRFPVVYDSEQRCSDGALEGRVVTKLSPGQPLEPLSRSVAGEAAQVHGNDTSTVQFQSNAPAFVLFPSKCMAPTGGPTSHFAFAHPNRALAHPPPSPSPYSLSSSHYCRYPTPMRRHHAPTPDLGT